MRRFLLTIITSLAVATAMADPIDPTPRKRVQPDGSTITLYGHGDEFFHYFTDSLGNVLELNAKGVYVPRGEKESSPSFRARRAKAREQAMADVRPHRMTGVRMEPPRVLVLLINFSDTVFKSWNTRAAINNMFNQEGYNFNGSPGSVRDYFITQSGGKYKPTFDVYGPITVSETQAYYGDGDGDTYRVYEMIAEACGKIDNQVNFKDYDLDNDGEIDFVYALYAGHGRSSSDYETTIWPHHSSGRHGRTDVSKFDGKYLTMYSCSNELRPGFRRTGIGTTCHEISHYLGLPDYYDTDKDDGNNPNLPGIWSLMCSGSHTNNSITPPNYSVYDKYFMGWYTPKVMDSKKYVGYTIEPGEGVCVTRDSKQPAYNHPDTVYYLENRVATGWDAYLPKPYKDEGDDGCGLLVWRVVYDQDIWGINRPNASGSDSRITVVSASGNRRPLQTTDDLFPGYRQKTWFKPFNNKMVSRIEYRTGSHIVMLCNDAPLLYVQDRMSLSTRTDYLGAVFNVHYQDNVNLRFHIPGVGDEKIVWTLEKKDDDGPWTAVKTGTVYRNQVRQGATVAWAVSFNEPGMASRLYRVKAQFPESGDKEFYSNVLDFVINYPYTYSANGQKKIVYVSPGETPKLPKPYDCMEREVESDFPVEETANGSYVIYTMPKGPLTITDQTNVYTVTFVDYDNTVLKTERVNCGGTATPPRLPEHDGMEFKRWEKDYTNVHKDLYVRASYAVPGYEMKMTMDYHRSDLPVESYASRTGTFAGSEEIALAGDDLAFSIQVKAPKTVTVRFQTCSFNAQNQPSWNDGEIVASLTDAQAIEGTLITKTVNIMKDFSDNDLPFLNRIGYRFQVSAWGLETMYSNVMYFELYYPVTLRWKKSDNMNIYAYTSKHSTFEDLYMPLQPADDDPTAAPSEYVTTMIPLRYKDKLYIRDLKGVSGCLNFARCEHTNWTLDTGENEKGIPYITDNGISETIDISIPEYTVYFKYLRQKANGSGLEWAQEPQKVKCGQAATPPTVLTDPTAPNTSTFIGWNSWNPSEYGNDAFLNVTKDNIGFEANFDYQDINTYTVIFRDYNRAELKKEFVEEGYSATPPADPVREGYTFLGWNGDYQYVTQDLTLTARYGNDNITYTVTFLDDDGTLIDTEVVLDGRQAYGTYPPHHTGLRFIGWDQDISEIRSDLTVRARYENQYYLITFCQDGQELQVSSVQEGQVPRYAGAAPTKEATDRSHFEFVGWTPELVAATGPAYYEARFNEVINTFTVIFQNWDHTQLSSQTVSYGAAAKAPTLTPTREGYKFVGWDCAFAQVYSDLTVTALFELPEEEDIVVAVEQMRQDAHACGETVKFIHRGTLYIARPDGKVFDANGREVKL